jgi:plastocyanin
MRAAVVVLGVAVALLAPGVASAANVDVGFGNFSYNPASVRIAPGDTVTWSGSFVGHPLSGPAPIGAQSTGMTRVVAFPAAGRFDYICTLHAVTQNMVGSVTVSANRPPVAAFTATAAVAGRPVTFTSTSSDPNPGQALSFRWDLDGDGAFDPGVTGATATRTYARAGAVTVRLRVTDSNGDVVGPESAETAQTIQVAGAAVAGAGATSVLGLTRSSLRRSGRRVSVRVRSTLAGRATLRLRRRGRTLAQGSARFAAPGTKTVRLTLTRRGRAAIRRGTRVRASLVFTVRPPSGASATLTRTVRVRG